MPKRVSTRKIVTKKAQGSDSWIEFRPMTYGERIAMIDESAQHTGEEGDLWQRQQTEKLFAEHVVNWNWVDDDGNPLALPKDDPTIIHRLNDLELDTINQLIAGQDPK